MNRIMMFLAGVFLFCCAAEFSLRKSKVEFGVIKSSFNMIRLEAIAFSFCGYKCYLNAKRISSGLRMK